MRNGPILPVLNPGYGVGFGFSAWQGSGSSLTIRFSFEATSSIDRFSSF